MPIKIQGTQKQDSGGFGLGSLLGKVAGAALGVGLAPVTGGGSLLAAGMMGSQLGGTLGGAAGGMVDPGSNKEMGVEVKGAKDSGSYAPKPQTSAIDRLNSIADIGSAVYGGAQSLNKLAAPAAMGASGGMGAIDRRLGNVQRMNAGY